MRMVVEQADACIHTALGGLSQVAVLAPRIKASHILISHLQFSPNLVVSTRSKKSGTDATKLFGPQKYTGVHVVLPKTLLLPLLV